MVAINDKEKAAIIEQYPRIHVVRTMKQDSKRHHYFMVEEPSPMRLLKKLRGVYDQSFDTRYSKRGGANNSL